MDMSFDYSNLPSAIKKRCALVDRLVSINPGDETLTDPEIKYIDEIIREYTELEPFSGNIEFILSSEQICTTDMISPMPKPLDAYIDALYKSANKNPPTLQIPAFEKKFDASVVDKRNLDKIARDLQSSSDFVSEWPLEGCEARALEMARHLESKGIKAGKIFIVSPSSQLIFNRLYDNFAPVRWPFHVAIVLLVKTHNKIEPQVIDPLLSNKPTSPEEWAKTFTQNYTHNDFELFYTNRFAYMPDDRHENTTEYRANNIQAAQNLLTRLMLQSIVVKQENIWIFQSLLNKVRLRSR